MRYYDITLTPAPTAQVPNPTTYRRWTSFVNGVFDGGALQTQFDLMQYPADQHMGASTVTIEGVALEDLQQAPNFQGMFLTIQGGMGNGLPLANPAQRGLLMAATVYQSFGNWMGTDMSIDFVIFPAQFTLGQQGNFVIDWRAGTSLKDALVNCLSIAYPGIKIIASIPNTYVRNHDVWHVCSTLQQLGAWLKKATGTKANPSGVRIFGPVNNVMTILDAQFPAQKVTQLAFDDLVGQPTWVQPGIMQVTTVMRGDIAMGTTLRMPKGLQSVPGIVQTTAGALPSGLKYKTAFQGDFLVQSIRHIGNFRDPSGGAWVTMFQCAAASVQSNV